MSPVSESPQLQAESNVITVLAAYIAENYASPLRIADLASHCHVSVRTLQNLCHAHCGEPPLKALRRFRLQQLHRLLGQRPWTPLRQLYLGCGLTGSLADRDLFFEMYGFTIREHQEACRSKVLPATSVLPGRSLEAFLPESA